MTPHQHADLSAIAEYLLEAILSISGNRWLEEDCKAAGTTNRERMLADLGSLTETTYSPWKRSIPDDLRLRWPDLPIEARMVARIMAQQIADMRDELWDRQE